MKLFFLFFYSIFLSYPVFSQEKPLKETLAQSRQNHKLVLFVLKVKDAEIVSDLPLVEDAQQQAQMEKYARYRDDARNKINRGEYLKDNSIKKIIKEKFIVKEIITNEEEYVEFEKMYPVFKNSAPNYLIVSSYGYILNEGVVGSMVYKNVEVADIKAELEKAVEQNEAMFQLKTEMKKSSGKNFERCSTALKQINYLVIPDFIIELFRSCSDEEKIDSSFMTLFNRYEPTINCIDSFYCINKKVPVKIKEKFIYKTAFKCVLFFSNQFHGNSIKDEQVWLNTLSFYKTHIESFNKLFPVYTENRVASTIYFYKRKWEQNSFIDPAYNDIIIAADTYLNINIDSVKQLDKLPLPGFDKNPSDYGYTYCRLIKYSGDLLLSDINNLGYAYKRSNIETSRSKEIEQLKELEKKIQRKISEIK